MRGHIVKAALTASTGAVLVFLAAGVVRSTMWSGLPTPAPAQPQAPAAVDPMERARTSLLTAETFPLVGFDQVEDGPTGYLGAPGWLRSLRRGEAPAAAFTLRLVFADAAASADALYRGTLEMNAREGTPAGSASEAAASAVFHLSELTSSAVVRLPDGLLWVVGSVPAATPEQRDGFLREVVRAQLLRISSGVPIAQR